MNVQFKYSYLEKSLCLYFLYSLPALESLCVFIVLALVLPTHSPLVQVDPCHTPLPQPLTAQTPGQEGPNPDKAPGKGDSRREGAGRMVLV